MDHEELQIVITATVTVWHSLSLRSRRYLAREAGVT